MEELSFKNSFYRIAKYVLTAITVLLIVFLLLSIFRVGLIYWLWSSVETWVTVRLGLDYYATQLLTTIVVSLVVAILPSIAWYLLIGKRKWQGTAAMIGGQALIFILVYTIGSSVCFDRRTGETLCWYADTPDGRYFSSTSGFHPKYGMKLEQYTQEIALGSKSPSKQSDKNEWTINVPANVKWFNTGIQVQKGTKLRINAIGTITWGAPGIPDGSNVVGPDGTRPPNGEGMIRFPMPEAGIGSLIMRIGNSKYAVGANDSIQVRESGTIELMVNDDVVGDNSGSFSVRITRENLATDVSKTITVDATKVWTDTGIIVDVGQKLIITSSGKVNTEGGTPNTDADGYAPGICKDSNCIAKGEPYGTLIGRIGNDNPFRVGTYLELTPTSKGELHFSVNDNDNYFSDNKGSFTVRIQ